MAYLAVDVAVPGIPRGLLALTADISCADSTHLWAFNATDELLAAAIAHLSQIILGVVLGPHAW